MTFYVEGVPAPKGSNRAIMRGGFAQLVPGGSDGGRKRMKSWATAVREAALDACAMTMEGRPIVVDIAFYLPKPKTVKRDLPMVKPDIDKLARCTLDALIGVAFDDDSRIVDLTVRKRYVSEGCEGARIVMAEATS